ncbi:hypothetical protein Tco_0691059 [Tanacetum coccineum]
MAEPILKKYMENAQAESNPAKPNINDDMNIKLSSEFLMELKNNAFHGIFDEDVVDHIAKGIDPLEFISRVNSSFENHKKVDGRTKKVLFHSWMNGSWNKRQMDNSILSNKEWKKSDYGNLLNTASDSFSKAHDEHEIEERNELRQLKRKEDIKNDRQPNKRVCKAEKFEAVKYSLGPDEEYIAIRRCEYNDWKRNEVSMSQIYQEIFQRRDDGWKITRTE